LHKPLDLPDADLILRSADHVSFRVHKSVLAMESQYFKDKISIPQSSSFEVVNGLPVIPLPEDAEVLNQLVPMLYPAHPAIPWSESQVLLLLATCQKYGMVSIQSSIRAEARQKPSLNLSGTAAFRTYGIASSERLTPEMEDAAHLTLDHPMTFDTLGEGLRLFEGWALRELVRFRKRCRDNVVACLESFLEARAGPSKIWVGCPDNNTRSDTALSMLGRPEATRPIAMRSEATPTNTRQGPIITRPQVRTVGAASWGIPVSVEAVEDPPSPSVSPPPRPRSPPPRRGSPPPQLHVEDTLPRWLSEFFSRKKDEMRVFTQPISDPSSIREGYLEALKTHTGCYFCLRVHATEGQKYLEELENRLSQARNKVNPHFLSILKHPETDLPLL
jgi:BTB/POZ domain